MAITYAVYMRKDEDTVLNAATMGLANNSISIIAGLAVLSAIFAVSTEIMQIWILKIKHTSMNFRKELMISWRKQYNGTITHNSVD